MQNVRPVSSIPLRFWSLHTITKQNKPLKNSFSSALNALHTFTTACVNKISRLLSSHKNISINPDYEAAEKVNLVIIGSGPAGYTAAIYAARGSLEPVIFEGEFTAKHTPGGQLMTTTDIENYPGFENGINGPLLMDNMRKQAMRFGAKMHEQHVDAVDFSRYPYFIKGQEKNYRALSVIIATGAKANRLAIEGTREGEFWQKGVSACATCDGAGPLFRKRDIYVIGGGDSAMEEASFLSEFAKKVFIVHRRNKLRASKVMQNRVMQNPKIEILWDSIITKVQGDRVVRQVVIKNLKTNKEVVREAGGVFFGIGHTPNTAFLKGQLKLDVNGFIKTKPGTTQTNIPFVHAAGDVQDPVYRQAITAAASGCMAAICIERELAGNFRKGS